MQLPRFDRSLTDSQRDVRRSIQAICDDFGHEYRRDHASDGTYPQEFVDEVGARANAAKYLAAEAAFDAADAAVQAHGGKGIATEYDVERYFRETRLSRLVPVTQQLALNYLGERELELPRSY